MLKKLEQKIHKYFHFHNGTEFTIFVLWALLVVVILLSITK
jgi:hypothetical protein